MIHRTSRTIVFCIACIALVAGIVARIEGLDHKLFWQDEAFSMLRITGHDEAQLYATFDGSVRGARSLLALDRLDARSSIAATITSLREEPQRGPLFYTVAALWARAAGDGIVPMRALSLLLGITGVGLAFGLGRRIGGSALGGVFLAALVAISPIEVQFSQQIREYVAIADAILASAWALLAAIDRPAIVRWVVYAISVVVGLYVSPLFLTALVSHAVVAIVAARRPGSDVRSLVWPLLSAAIAVAAYAPWAIASVAVSGAHANDLAWLHGDYGMRAFAIKWTFNVGAVFFDSEFARANFAFALPPIFVLIFAAFATAFRREKDPLPRTLALATVACSVLPLVAIDLATHAHFETVTRYQMATWIGIDLLVASALARFARSPAPTVRSLSVASFVFLVACGTFSAVFDRTYPVWWDNNEHLDERLVAHEIAAGPTPALVLASRSSGTAPFALVLAHYVEPSTSFLAYGDELPALPAWKGGVYVFVPSAATIVDVRKRFARSGFRLQNESPALTLTIPDLRSARDARDAEAVSASNALWARLP